MCHSLLSEPFGTSLAINSSCYLVVKIGMDIYCFWWPYRFWGIIRKNKLLLLLILGTFKSIQGTAP